MSDIQEIDVTVDRDGNVHIEVRGVRGPGCEALTAELERMLGGVVAERRHTDAYHQAADVDETVETRRR